MKVFASVIAFLFTASAFAKIPDFMLAGKALPYTLECQWSNAAGKVTKPVVTTDADISYKDDEEGHVTNLYFSVTSEVNGKQKVEAASLTAFYRDNEITLFTLSTESGQVVQIRVNNDDEAAALSINGEQDFEHQNLSCHQLYAG